MASTQGNLPMDRHLTEPQSDTQDGSDNASIKTQNDTITRTKSAASRVPTATENPKFSLWREIGLVAIICMAQLLTQAGLAQSIAPLYTIGDSFGTPTAGQLSWLPAAFSLTVGTFILPAGRWGDLYGHRRLFMLGYLWFGVWTLIAGFAAFSHSLIFFAFCRAIQGIGPAMLIPNGLAILGRTYPPGKRKNMVFSLFGATAPGGFILGALFSGIFAELVWWPWTYWTSGIVLLICGVLVNAVVPNMPVYGDKPKLAELDIWGTLTGVLGLVMVNFAWNEGPAAGWDQVYVYVLLIIGLLILAAFFYIEFTVAEHPLMPKFVFSRVNNLVLGCIAAGWGSFGIWIYYFWAFQQRIRGHSILLTTAQNCPTAISGAVAAVVTGRLLGSLGPGWVMLIAMFAFLIGNTLLATAPVVQTYWANIFISTIITPWGMDMSFPAGTIVLSNFMPPEAQGMAASILCVIQNYSISIGLGMAGTVEAHVSDGDLLKGYRGAWYLGIGLDVVGISLAALLVMFWMSHERAEKRAQEEGKSEQA